LLGKDPKTNVETTAIAMQQVGKYASAAIELLVENYDAPIDKVLHFIQGVGLIRG
jgi:hypothetical protein